MSLEPLEASGFPVLIYHEPDISPKILIYVSRFGKYHYQSDADGGQEMETEVLSPKYIFQFPDWKKVGGRL